MTDPTELDERLSAYLDGELSADEASEIRLLLESSALARAEFEAVTEAREFVRGLPLLEPPPDVVRMLRRGSPLAPVRSSGKPARTRLSAIAISAVATAAFWGVVVGTTGFSASVSSVDTVVAAHSSVIPTDAVAVDSAEMDNMPMPSEPPGMTLVHVERLGRATHAMYSDGAQQVSVFAEPGRVDWSAMSVGDRVEIGGDPGWHGSIEGYDVVVVQRGRNVFTIVAETSDEMMDMGESMTVDEKTSIGDRVRDAADNLVQTFGLRG
ncbi:MAG: anti-sigma factor family protein [Acidimicrobiales bacterium]|jgi:hypothetical protein